ncbi:MAG TPA: hypothetical protein PK468_20220, partial [Candidatus Hydrogenedentes bacterium]|nr:hypothetical protein [Candidatus Hydrogenedentota bacterium]
MSYTLVIAAFVAMLLVPGVARAIEAGDAVDVALSGQQQRWDEEGRDLGVLWEDARDVFRVVVRFKDAVPAPDTVHIEYWASSWPHRRIPRDELSGAGSSGWLDVGDWFQGEWVKADAVVQAEGMALAYTFNPVNKAEFTDLDDFDATYRSTLKIRIVGDTALPEIV